MLIEKIFNYLQNNPRGPTFLKIWNLIIFILLVIFNVLSSVGLIGYWTPQQVTNIYVVPVTPDRYAFSIWGLIWFLQAAFVLYSLLPIDNDKDAFVIASAPISLLWIGELAWLFPFSYNIQALALGFFVYMLVTVEILYAVFHYTVKRIDTDAFTFRKKVLYWFIFYFHISLNTAWILVAFIFQFFVTLCASGVVVPDGIYITSLVVVAAIGLLVCASTYDLAFVATIIWSFIAIWLNEAFPISSVKITVLVLLVVETVVSFGLIMVVRLLKKKAFEYIPIRNQE